MKKLTNEELERKEQRAIDSLIENNIDRLRDIHAKNYNGTDDDMPDRFNDWIEGFSMDELVILISK